MNVYQPKAAFQHPSMPLSAKTPPGLVNVSTDTLSYPGVVSTRQSSRLGTEKPHLGGINIAPGTYVVAVSGGVDSIVLLDLLRQQPDIKLVVAHFDHGIRSDSKIDRELVQALASQNNLPFVHHEGRLGAGASEEVARRARYAFLHKVRVACGARAVITAHHHDDAAETAIINMLRGTSRKGLSSLGSKNTILRPLLHLDKEYLRQHAKEQGLVWREDTTNEDIRYLRNYVRHRILPRFSPKDRQQLKDLITRAHELNDEIDTQLMHYLHVQPASDKLDRKLFARLPHIVAREVMAAWLRKHAIRDFDQKTLERLVIAAKTLAPGKTTDIVRGTQIKITKDYLALQIADR